MIRRVTGSSCRERDDPGGGPLQHDGAGALAGERRDEGHRGRPRADHHHAPSRQLEVVRPELRVHDLAAEVLPPRELGGVAARVVVVAGAGVEEGARPGLGRAVGALGGHRPAGRLRGPRRVHRAGAEADPAVDAVLGGHGLDVATDALPVGQRLVALPGPEHVAEGEDVGVGPDAGVAEQVPGAADPLPGLEDGVAAVGATGLQPVRRPDPRQAGADHQHVDGVVGVAGGPGLLAHPLSLPGAGTPAAGGTGAGAEPAPVVLSGRRR